MDNKEIAHILQQTADILEINDENLFKINAYRRASQSIESLAGDVNQAYQQGKLQSIPGVGKGIANYIKDLIETGTCREFERLKKEIPLGVLKLLQVEGLGPKKVKLFYKKFRVNSLYKLEKLIKSHKLLKLKGWGKKSEENILKAITLYKRFNQRFLLGIIYPLAQEIVKELKESKLVNQVEVCGSLRRWQETVGDLDILATSKNPERAVNLFTTLKDIKRIVAKGPTKAHVILKQGIAADLRVVKPESFGAAIHYFTGSKAHNIRIRRLGMNKGLRINEYGVYKYKRKTQNAKRSPDGEAGKMTNQNLKIDEIRKFIKIGGKTEQEVFKAVGLPWIPPELRENNGEIEAAKKGKLPKLVNLNDIKGDCHLHTKWSDGRETIMEMAEQAKKIGYEYIAITDHASSIRVANGLDAQRTLKYLKAIKKADEKIKGIKILSGIEVDIKKDGSLYLPDKILKQIEVVIAAVHSGFKTNKQEMTERIIKAMENPYVHILAHPTGRLINKREPYQADINQIFEKAKKTKTVLEINAHWRRLDLNANQARLAHEKGVEMVISTDAHNSDTLELMKFGVATARKGWLEKKDVINALPLKQFLKVLKRK